jgi:hypothetical protein
MMKCCVTPQFKLSMGNRQLFDFSALVHAIDMAGDMQ